jgi:hypothetical protein
VRLALFEHPAVGAALINGECVEAIEEAKRPETPLQAALPAGRILARPIERLARASDASMYRIVPDVVRSFHLHSAGWRCMRQRAVRGASWEPGLPYGIISVLKSVDFRIMNCAVGGVGR